MSRQLKTENVRGLCCRVIAGKSTVELVKACYSLGIRFDCNTLTEGKTIWARSFKEGIYFSNTIDERIFTEVPAKEFIAKLLAPLPEHTTPFAEQVAANIIKISCSKDIPYADKMKMVVQAILEFERNPKNQQPKKEKA